MARLLTLDDLYNFYSTKKRSTHFSAGESDEPIAVQVEGKLSFKKSNDAEGLLPVRLQACHTEQNLNKSNISFDTMEQKLLPSFKNRPILGYIHEVDGENQFYDHRMHTEGDGDDEKLVYDEIAVGIIPETNNAELVYDEENDHYNVMVDGYIFEEYTQAADILRREETCSVSVEISIREMSWNAKSSVLNIEDGYFSGVTILGKNPDGSDVKPGMANSKITIKDFAKSKNSNFSSMTEEENNKLIETLERLEGKIDGLTNFNDRTSTEDEKIKEGGQNISMTKFEELLAKYEKTSEDVTFEVEGLSDEELEAAFAEAFGEDEPVEDPTSDDDAPVEPETEGEEGDEPAADPEPEQEQYNAKFALTLNEIECALWNLVNTTYGDDDEWYSLSVEVFEDNTLIMHNWSEGKTYRQSYGRDGEDFTLKGDRVEVFAEWLTSDEIEELNELRSNYSLVSEKLSKYEEAEEMADKMTVFNDESYAQYLETEEFKALMSEESVKQYSKEELETKADVLFAKLVKADGSFAAKAEENTTAAKTPTMFAFGAQDHSSSFLDGLLKKN